ncbi:MAG: hypothetical protein KDK45_24985, partial [Leptospiraceae bacterium]|nr:hypothetical protein [Leptospiraceae bacterium]
MELSAIPKKASKFVEIDSAVKFDIPVSPDHEFFTNFEDVRGEFNENLIYSALNVSEAPETSIYTYNETNPFNKSLVFLAGHRGSGKTSEIQKWVQKLDNPDCFLCITCNIDKGLDKNDVEYTDILIFQLEQLFKRLEEKNILVESDILEEMQAWYAETIREVNKKLTSKMEIEAGLETKASIPFLSKLFMNLKAGILGSTERATVIRSTIKNNFSEFASKFNMFIYRINELIKTQKVAREVFFVVDGLEKTMSTESRRKIIMEESNRIQEIKVNTLFTLPVELMSEQRRLENFSTIIPFPFVKLIERDGARVEKAIERYRQFIYKRVSKELFDSDETVEKVVLTSGGSPRELLRILEYTAFYSDKQKGILTRDALNKAVK